jgi:hypothetical protein
MSKRIKGCIRDEMKDEYSNKGNYEVKFRKINIDEKLYSFVEGKKENSNRLSSRYNHSNT